MRVVFHLLITTVSLLAACADVPGESTTRATVLTANRVTVNGVTANRVTVNRLPATRLSTSRLSDGTLSVNMDSAGKLLSTEDGREVFSFIVSCALPSDIMLSADVDGTTYGFSGELGLAPEWLTSSLTSEGQGWISACIFARVNANDVALPISMRGANLALATDADERAAWSVEEGAFYGNLFTPMDQPILWVACRGAGQASGEFGGLIERDCAEPDPGNPGFTRCGFIYAGDCGSFSSNQACEQFSAGGSFYRRCHEAPLTSPVKNGGSNPLFSQVITTYVTP
jgi:hypothetical protein